MNKFRNLLSKCKKGITALSVALVGAAAFAEGTTGSSIDLTPATTALNDMKTALMDWVTAAAPVVVAIAGGFLVFWVIRLVIKLVKRAGSSS